MSKLLEQAKKLPKESGAYLFCDKKGGVLYVGRAVSLRRRALNYFQKYLDPRLKEMVIKASTLKYFKTANLLEAIILEANLIKKYWPKYNIKDRDDRSFAYIVIPKMAFSHPVIIRGHELRKFVPKNAHIFGPYKSLSLIETALRIIRRVFPYCTCLSTDALLTKKNKFDRIRPCLDYQIGLCPGPCFGYISKEEYQKNIDNLIFLLKGEQVRLLKKLKKENPEKAEALKHIQDVALLKNEDRLLTRINRIEGYDISHFGGKDTYGSMVVFEGNEAKKEDYRLFKIKEAPQGDDLRALEEVLSRRIRHLEWHLPDLILIDGGRPQVECISKLFQIKRVTIPFVGISKYQNDKLVFPKDTSYSLREMVASIKETLLKVREESHRFAISANRRKSRKSLK
jgi:excinuclease ABC subunit C